jgi:hypothetical protein
MPRRGGRYMPLVAYLIAHEADSVTLTFTQIEELIGRPLSLTAQVSSAFWTATHGLRFLRDLHALGWRARLDVKERAVEFRRTPGDE